MIYAALIRILLALRKLNTAAEESNRISKERLALELDRMAMEYPAWHKAGNRVPIRGKVSIEHVKTEDWAENYHRTHDNG